MTPPRPSPQPGVHTRDPQVVNNPPGLDAIAYRVDNFTGFRRALLRALPGERAIGAWRPAAGDLGLQVLEWWAYLADVLTFYNERFANESYLRTAMRADSIANLVALLGYQGAPGIAASGQVAVVRTPGDATQPLVIPAGMELSSTATPGVASQTFEVDAEAAFTGACTLQVALPPDTTLLVAPDSTVNVLLAGPIGGIKVGDELLLVARNFVGAGDDWCAVTVSAIAPASDPATGALNTLVTLSSPVSGWQQSLRWLAVLVSSRPDCTQYRLMRPTGAAAVWNQGGGVKPPIVSVSGAGAPAGGATVSLSAVVRAIAPGDLVLFDRGVSGGALAVVTGMGDALAAIANPSSTASAAQPPLIVPHSQLSLALGSYSAAALATATTSGQAIGSLVVRYGFRDVGEIIGRSPATLPSLPATVLTPRTQAPPVGASALLQDAAGAGAAVTVSGVTVSGGSAAIRLVGAGTPPATLTTPLSVPLSLLLDVVGVSRGATASDEVLGSGNAALANQAFALANSPLTYLAGSGGPVSTLAVYVNGVRWNEVPSFYRQGAEARVYVVSRSTDQTVTTVTFGDGVAGARLPSGTGNVVATYRYGSGASSPPAGRLTTIRAPQPNLASIQNPVAVSGGADPQSADAVRVDAPGAVSTFGRAISATDYRLIAARAPGVARATAYLAFDHAARRSLVTVYVGDDQAAVAAATQALSGAEDPSRPIAVLAATPNTIGVSCTLVVSPDREVAAVVAAARAAITDPVAGLFSPAGLGIGEPLYRSAVSAALMVRGVVAVHSLLVRSSEQEVFDPGVGGFFVLVRADVAIAGVTQDA